MVSTSTLLLILAIWFIGYLGVLYFCREKWNFKWLDSLVISCASWGILILYAIHWVYNTFFVNHDNDNINN